MLPTFLVIGVAKAGTTALQHYLEAHPEIFMCPRKDTNFFAWQPELEGDFEARGTFGQKFPVRGLAEYEALFQGAGRTTARGEISTYYIESEHAPVRMRQIVPKAKLVAMLRHPVDRAYSGYQMQVRLGSEQRPPEEALRPDSHYARVGRYGALLTPFYREFPPEQIRVYLFEEFKRNAAAVLGGLFRFLGVSEDFTPDLSVRHNVGGVPRSRLLHRLYTSGPFRRTLLPLLPSGLRRAGSRLRGRNMAKAPMLPEPVRARLIDSYRDDVSRLGDLVGRDLGPWLSGSEPLDA